MVKLMLQDEQFLLGGGQSISWNTTSVWTSSTGETSHMSKATVCTLCWCDTEVVNSNKETLSCMIIYNRITLQNDSIKSDIAHYY